jgi:CBS-domain-containing membrane protein
MIMAATLPRKTRLAALKRLKAANVMTPNSTSIPRTKTVRKAAEFLNDAGIETAPVTDKTGRLVGVLSSSDVSVHCGQGPERRPGTANENYARHALNAGIYPQTQQGARLTVQQIMNPEVCCVESDAPIAQVIEQLVERRIRRLFVIDQDGALVGDISIFDMLRILGELLDAKRTSRQ